MTDTHQKVYFKTEDGVEQYDSIQDAIAISDSTVRVELTTGEKAKKDGWLIGAFGDSWEVMIQSGRSTHTFSSVDKVFQMPHHRVKFPNQPAVGGTIKRIQRV